MKIKSNKEVNIRAFEPYRKSNNLKGILKPGFEIEVEEVEGEEITEGEGVNQVRSKKWYKDKNGDFYWSGGFERTEELKNQIQNNDLYLKFITNLTGSINLHSKGEGISIAVLDSGIEKSHDSINSKVIMTKDFLNDSTELEFDHGTKVAGILVAEEEFINGISPKAKLHDFRVIANSEVVNNDSVVKALKFISEQSAQINLVNMSLAIGANYVQDVQRLVNILLERNIFCVIATGDYKFSQQLRNIIKVQVSDIYSVKFDQENSVTISFPNSAILTTSKHGSFSKFKDASAYTALTTGMLSTLFSSKQFPSSVRLEEIANFFKNNPILKL